MNVDRIEVSEKFYNELLNNSDNLKDKSIFHCRLFDGIRVVVNKKIKEGYKIIYK